MSARPAARTSSTFVTPAASMRRRDSAIRSLTIAPIWLRISSPARRARGTSVKRDSTRPHP